MIFEIKMIKYKSRLLEHETLDFISLKSIKIVCGSHQSNVFLLFTNHQIVFPYIFITLYLERFFTEPVSNLVL